MDNSCSQELSDKIEGRNFKKFGLDMNPIVSFASGAFILAICLYALLNLEQAYDFAILIQEIIARQLDWVFIISSNFIVIVCIFLALSRLGNVRIGGVNCEKEFGNFAWYSMLISAGMGIGLMFWAVGEPLTHFIEEPPIFGHSDASFTAMATTFYHWGLHPWGIYALMALALAFFAYNHNMPLSLRSVFYFLFKDKIYGVVGDIIDTFAVLSVLFGLAASLGLGVQQINSGLDYLLGVGIDVWIQVVLIALITLVAIVSIILGIHKGIKTLAMVNMYLAFKRLYHPPLFQFPGRIFQQLSSVFFFPSRRWQRLAGHLDHPLPGLVDRLVPLCGNVYCQDISWSHGQGINHRGPAGPLPAVLFLADCFWRHSDQYQPGLRRGPFRSGAGQSAGSIIRADHLFKHPPGCGCPPGRNLYRSHRPGH